MLRACRIIIFGQTHQMKLLEGKTALLITGASRGIGKGMAEVFVQNGADVAFTFLSSEKAAAELGELSQHGTKSESL